MFKQIRRNSTYIICLLECLLLFLLLTGCDEIFRNPYTREISPGVKLNQDWTEFEISPPLEAINMIQSVVIEFNDEKKWDIVHPDWEKWDGKSKLETILTLDGKVIDINVQVIANDDKVFDMDSIGIGRGLIFTHYAENMKLTETKSTLPKSKRYKKIRIRSSKPVKTAKINWVCTTNH